MPAEKKKRPAWIIPVSVLSAIVVTWIYLGVVEGVESAPFGIKGEGILIMLVLYLAFRVLFALTHWLVARTLAK